MSVHMICCENIPLVQLDHVSYSMSLDFCINNDNSKINLKREEKVHKRFSCSDF